MRCDAMQCILLVATYPMHRGVRPGPWPDLCRAWPGLLLLLPRPAPPRPASLAQVVADAAVELDGCVLGPAASRYGMTLQVRVEPKPPLDPATLNPRP